MSTPPSPPKGPPRIPSDNGRRATARIDTVIDERYWIRKSIGSGAMGQVFLAVRERLGCPVAIKFLHAAAASEPRFLRRFEVEARALGRLRHPHCVSVIDFGVADVPYIVMPYIDGPTLRDLLVDGPVSTALTLTIARQLLAGLAHAHQCGVVHRDIKPANIKLEDVTGSGNHVRILDFGLAKLTSGKSDLPASNPFIAVGTPSYMSPEQFTGTAVDARSDIYSTGVLLFELLTGRKPFAFDSAVEGYKMHADGTRPRPRLRDVAPERGFSAQLEQVLQRAMAPRPDARFQSALAFAEALERLPDGADCAVPMKPGKPARADATARIARLPQLGIRGLLIAAALACATVIAVAGTHRWSETRPRTAQVARPDIAEAHTLVERADALFERMRWSAALPLYREALALDPSLRDRATIHANAVRALGGGRSHREAARVIEHDLGAAAIPTLERAVRDGPNARVRRRARRLLTKLATRPQP